MFNVLMKTFLANFFATAPQPELEDATPFQVSVASICIMDEHAHWTSDQFAIDYYTRCTILLFYVAIWKACLHPFSTTDSL